MSSYSFKWIVQRITAAILIPLTFWFVYNCVLFSKLDYQSLIIFFNSYLNSSLFLIMMISMMIHTILGCETIITDYFLDHLLSSGMDLPGPRVLTTVDVVSAAREVRF